MLIGDSLPWAGFNNKFGLKNGELSIWAGFNGHGKTTLLSHIIVDSLAKGNKWLVAAMEAPADCLTERMVRQVTAGDYSIERDNHNIDLIFDLCWFYNKQSTTTAGKIIETFETAYKDNGVDHFLIDSLTYCGVDVYKYKDFFVSLRNFTKIYNAQIHLIAHCTPKNYMFVPGKLDIIGRLVYIFDNTITIWRNKRKEKGEISPEYDCMLHYYKQKDYEWEGAATLYFDKDSQQYLLNQNDKPKCYCDIVAKVKAVNL